MRITNNGQFTNLFNRRKISFPMNENNPQRPLPDYSVDSKKLSSQSWVTVKNRSKGQRLTDTGNYKVVHFGNVWMEKPVDVKVNESVVALDNTIKVFKSKLNKSNDPLERAKLSQIIGRLNRKLSELTKKEKVEKDLTKVTRNRVKTVVKKQRPVADLPKSDRNIRHNLIGGVYHQTEILNLKRAV